MLTESMLKEVQGTAEADQRIKELSREKVLLTDLLSDAAKGRIEEAGRAALADYVLAEAAQAIKAGDRNFYFRADAAWLMGRDHCLEVIARMRGTRG